MAERVAHVRRLLAVVHGGHWARLTMLERGVWQVLYAGSDFESGHVAMAMTVIARLAGINNLQRAREAVQSLQQLGLVALVHEGGGKGDVTVREVLAPEPLPAAWRQTEPLSGPVTNAPVRVLNGDGGASKQGRSAALNRAGERLQTGPVSGPLFTNTRNTPPPPAATGPLTGPVIKMPAWVEKEEEEEFLKLQKRGIWEESMEQILRDVPRADRDRLWTAVVNDPNAKKKSHCYFKRLRKFLESRSNSKHPQTRSHS